MATRKRHSAEPGGAFESFGPVHRGLQRGELLRRLAVERRDEKRCWLGHFAWNRS
jgi:hypothetical protein